MLRSHGKENLFEEVGVIIDQSEHPTKLKDNMVEEPAVHIGFNPIDQEQRRAGHRGQGISPTASSIFCLPLFQISFGGHPSQTTAFFWQFRQAGWVSLRFFFPSSTGDATDLGSTLSHLALAPGGELMFRSVGGSNPGGPLRMVLRLRRFGVQHLS